MAIEMLLGEPRLWNVGGRRETLTARERGPASPHPSLPHRRPGLSRVCVSVQRPSVLFLALRLWQRFLFSPNCFRIAPLPLPLPDHLPSPSPSPPLPPPLRRPRLRISLAPLHLYCSCSPSSVIGKTSVVHKKHRKHGNEKQNKKKQNIISETCLPKPPVPVLQFRYQCSVLLGSVRPPIPTSSLPGAVMLSKFTVAVLVPTLN